MNTKRNFGCELSHISASHLIIFLATPLESVHTLHGILSRTTPIHPNCQWPGLDNVVLRELPGSYQSA